MSNNTIELNPNEWIIEPSYLSISSAISMSDVDGLSDELYTLKRFKNKSEFQGRRSWQKHSLHKNGKNWR